MQPAIRSGNQPGLALGYTDQHSRPQSGTTVAPVGAMHTTAPLPVAGARRRNRESDSCAGLMPWRYLRYGLIAIVLYALVVPFVLVDLGVTIYQWVCFPLCGLRRVRRSAYFTYDRHRLPYLTGVQKLNCTYCAYTNGLLAYVREVTARTEAYWCPIKHDRTTTRDAHAYYGHFAHFGDADGFRAGVNALPPHLTSTRAPNVGTRQPRMRRRRTGLCLAGPPRRRA